MIGTHFDYSSGIHIDGIVNGDLIQWTTKTLIPGAKLLDAQHKSSKHRIVIQSGAGRLICIDDSHSDSTRSKWNI